MRRACSAACGAGGQGRPPWEAPGGTFSLLRGRAAIHRQRDTGDVGALHPTAGTARRWRFPPAGRVGPSGSDRRASRPAFPASRRVATGCPAAPQIPAASAYPPGPGQTALTRIFSRAYRFDSPCTSPTIAELRDVVHRAELRAGQARGRRGIQQRCAAAGAQFRQRRLGGDQHGADVQVHREFEIFPVQAFDRGRSGMTDMVPDEIRCRTRGSFRARSIWRSRPGADRRTARLPCRRRPRSNLEGARPRTCIQIHDRDRGALLGEADGAGAAHGEPAAVTMPILLAMRMDRFLLFNGGL